MSNKNKPAMPVLVTNPQTCISNMEEGLTKREHFAGLAMQQILSKYDPYEYGDFDSSDYETTVKHSIGLADELLKQLDK